MKRNAPFSHQKNPDELSPKRRKLLSDYKQRTPKKSPHKTPTKRKTPRLRCINQSCRVGFSTARAKIQHERFLCPLIKSSRLEVLSNSSNSAEVEKNCRFCDMVFSQAASRVRHEQNKHRTSASASPVSDSKVMSSPAANLSVSPLLSSDVPEQNEPDLNDNWKTPKSSRHSMVFGSVSSSGSDKNKLDDKSECHFCKQKFVRSYRRHLHEESCIFKLPEMFKEASILCQIPRLKLIKHSERLTNMLGYACIEDLYLYNQLASLCVPGIYPLVFLGKSHFFNKTPPIVKKTAFNKSLDILMKLLRLHSKVTLYNHLILVDETSGAETYLGPRLLIPESQRFHITDSDTSTTTVALKPVESSEDSDEDSDEMDDDEDITVTIRYEDENSVPESSSQPAGEETLLCDDGLSEEDRKYLSDLFSRPPDVDGLGGPNEDVSGNEADDASGNGGAHSNTGKDIMIVLSEGFDFDNSVGRPESPHDEHACDGTTDDNEGMIK